MPRPAATRRIAALLLLNLLALVPLALAGLPASVQADTGGPASALPAPASPADLGLWRGFIPNRGQFLPAVDFAWAGGGLGLRVEGGVLRWTDGAGGELARLDLGASAWRGAEPLPGRLHVYLGSDRRFWARDLPRYSRLKASSVGGASWELRAADSGLQLACRGGAACRVAGRQARLDGLAAAGLLRAGRQSDAAPAGGRADRGFVAEGPASGWQAAWSLLPLGRAQAPGEAELVYSTYLGGGQDDQVRGLAVDAEGRALVAGATNSADLPLAGRPFQGVMGSSGQLQDAFVARLAADGRSLEWAGFLGGSRQDEALDLAVDAAGRPTLVGYTLSGDWPMEKPIQPRVNLADGNFSGDAFVARLSADGSRLDYSTPLGGTSRDIAKAVAVDGAGYTVVGGLSASNFPTVNAVQRLNRGGFDVFLLKLNPNGDGMTFSTLLGGTDDDALRDLALDAAGDIHAVGQTRSLNFRFANPAYQVGNAGGLDAFYLKLSADGSRVLASTCFGGKADDLATGLAIGPDGGATLIGQTRSADLPRERPMQATRSGDTDLFLARFSPDGLRLVFGSYWGGSGDEGECAPPEVLRTTFTPTPDPRDPERLPQGSRFSDAPPADVAVDAAGRIALASCSRSANYPLASPLPFGRRGAHNLVLSVLDPAAGTLAFSTWLGGSGTSIARRLEWSAAGELYLAGQTDAVDFPTWPDPPLQARRQGQSDGFVLKLGLPEDLRPPASPTATVTASPIPSSTASPPPTVTREPTPTAPLPSATATVAGTEPSPSPARGTATPPDRVLLPMLHR